MNRKILSLCIALTVLFSCQSNAVANKIVYTTVKNCAETVANDNAAFSELDCGALGGSTLKIKQQSPQYFTLLLNTAGAIATSELETYTAEAPMEPGKVIEWHLSDNQPRFMVFRISFQQDAGKMTQLLTLNLVAKDRICPLASIDTAKMPKANEKMHELIKTDFANAKECPQSILAI